MGIHIYRHPMVKEGNSAFGYIREYSCRPLLGDSCTRGGSTCDGDFTSFRDAIRRIPFFWSRSRSSCSASSTFSIITTPIQSFISPSMDKKDLLYKMQVWLEKLTYFFSDVVMATNRSYAALAVDERWQAA